MDSQKTIHCSIALFFRIGVVLFITDTQNFKEIVKKNVATAVESCNTQFELARKAGLTQGAISKYIRAESLPTGVTAKKLCA